MTKRFLKTNNGVETTLDDENNREEMTKRFLKTNNGVPSCLQDVLIECYIEMNNQ